MSNINIGLLEAFIILAVCLVTLVIMGLLFYFLYRLLRASQRAVAAAPEMKDCASCGRSMPVDAVYCPYCGREVAEPPAENVVS